MFATEDFDPYARLDPQRHSTSEGSQVNYRIKDNLIVLSEHRLDVDSRERLARVQQRVSGPRRNVPPDNRRFIRIRARLYR